MTYNISVGGNATSIYDFVSNVNDGSNGLYGIIILLAFFVVIYGLTKSYDTVTALITSSFSVFIIASLMFFIGLIDWAIAIIPFSVFVVTLIYKVASSP